MNRIEHQVKTKCLAMLSRITGKTPTDNKGCHFGPIIIVQNKSGLNERKANRRLGKHDLGN